MTGTLINLATVTAGSLAGLWLRSELPERFRTNILTGLGLATIVLGVSEGLQTTNILIPIGSILLGGLLGELLHIERALERFAAWAGGRIGQREDRFATGFVTASLLFCIGPMTFWGSIQDGLGEGYQLLAVKSLMDGFASLALASTLGIGVLFSTVCILVIQGGLTLSAGFLEARLTDTMTAEITSVGGFLILAIGLRLLNLKNVPVANYLPALAIAPVIVAVVEWVSG